MERRRIGEGEAGRRLWLREVGMRVAAADGLVCLIMVRRRMEESKKLPEIDGERAARHTMH